VAVVEVDILGLEALVGLVEAVLGGITEAVLELRVLLTQVVVVVVVGLTVAPAMEALAVQE
jgi:hypothetical protein